MKQFISQLPILLLFATCSINATQGVSDAAAYSVAVQNDGAIVAAGTVTLNNVSQMMVARYTSGGLADTSYGNNGYVATQIGGGSAANSLLLLNNNKAVVAGYGEPNAGSSFVVAQYTTGGVLDTSFNTTGSAATLIGAGCSGNGIGLQSTGNIVVAGVAVVNGTPMNGLARYTSSGALDSSFGSNGTVTTQINDRSVGNAVAIQSDDQIVVGGSTLSLGANNFAVARYNTADGSLDTNFNSAGSQPGTVTTTVGANAAVLALALQSNGQIVAGGRSDNGFALARYNSDGTIDTNFGNAGIVKTAIGSSSEINGIAIQVDGKIVTVGPSDQVFALARYNTDGSLDTTFNSSGSVPGTLTTTIGEGAQASAVALQSDGKIIVAGSSDNGAIVARYNTDGSQDMAFGPNANGYISFPNSSQAPQIFGLSDINFADDAGVQYHKLNLNAQIMDADIHQSAGIKCAKLATIGSPGKILNQATTASSSNSAGAIVTRDSLGNFSANAITSDIVGDVTGSASNNLLKAGDTMTGTLVAAAGSADNPSIQFSGSTNSGFSASSNTVTMSTNGAGRVIIDSNGAVTINTPDSGTGFTVNGGGATITGDVANSGNVSFNTAGTTLNAVGSTQGPLVKVFTGSGNTGLTSSVSIDYTAAGFTAVPQIFLTSINGSVNALGVNSVTTTGATVLSGGAVSVPFNYCVIGI